MVNQILLGLIESVLGKSNPTARGNHAFSCPFCHHKNPKLEINLVPNKKNENLWHCWVCDAKGKTLFSLFKRIKVASDKFIQLKDILGVTEKHDVVEANTKVELPLEYKPLYNLNKSDIHARHALVYLKKRGLTMLDILKYQIGYCEKGRYANKIIIPTYNADGILDYFVARSFEKEPSRKYDAPSSDKNIIGFENMINWNVPIVLCEGAFDAISIKRNAIPLFGKNISKKLMQFCELPWNKKCLEFYKRKDLISKTASNIQIRESIYKHSIDKYLPYKKLLVEYSKKYTWFN